MRALENTVGTCYVTWKEMELRLIKGKDLDNELQCGNLQKKKSGATV